MQGDRLGRCVDAGGGKGALYPGCAISGAPWSQVEIHHVVFREHGGPTSLDNLIPLSRRWHHAARCRSLTKLLADAHNSQLHDEGWRLDMDTDRSLRLYRPDGTLHLDLPPPTPVLSQADTTLAA